MKTLERPLPPEHFVGDAWMYDPESRRAYNEGLLLLDAVLKPVTDALEASGKITERDLCLVFNAH